jgi:hypothetical protein
MSASIEKIEQLEILVSKLADQVTLLAANGGRYLEEASSKKKIFVVYFINKFLI